MAKAEHLRWPDFAELSQHGEGASLSDDLGRGTLSVSVIVPHWTERSVSAYDRQTGQMSNIRFFCPLAGDGKSQHTLLAVYNLQGALLRDAQPPLIGNKVKLAFHSSKREREGDARLADSGQGGLLVQRVNRDCLALIVTDDEKLRAGEKATSVTVFFNRLRSPHTYTALMALGKGIRTDNKYTPFAGYRTDLGLTPSAA